QHRLHSWVLEPQPLQGVSKLDIDAEIIGIELELITLEQPGVLVDIESQSSDFAVDGQFPMPVTCRLGLEVNARSAVRQFMLGHGVSSRCQLSLWSRSGLAIDLLEHPHQGLVFGGSEPLDHMRLMLPGQILDVSKGLLTILCQVQ